jgi:hypothetical protein
MTKESEVVRVTKNITKAIAGEEVDVAMAALCLVVSDTITVANLDPRIISDYLFEQSRMSKEARN